MHTTIRNTMTIIVALLATTLAHPAHADQNPPPPMIDAKLVESNTRFALDLYAQLSKDAPNDNIFFSPLSLSSALAMTYAGARGNTAKEMKDALHFDLDPAQLHPAMGELLKSLESAKEKPPYQLNIANALWVEQTYGLLPDYVTLCQDKYRAAAHPVDFMKAAEAQRKTINNWVEEHTNGKIKEAISDGVLNPDTSLVLTNTVYFKSEWYEQFRREATKEAPFKIAGGKSVQVPLMSQTEEFSYLEQPDLQILELGYARYDLAMIVLLPREVDGLAKIEKMLNAHTLDAWMMKLRDREVIVEFPRFGITSSYQLDRKLQALGMRDAFSAKTADFSGMSGSRPLFVDAVVHQTFVQVDEEGTEAAAVVAAAAAKAKGPEPPPPPAVFRADHPFLFLIRDTRSGAILFLGRVMNPKA